MSRWKLRRNTFVSVLIKKPHTVQASVKNYETDFN